LFQLFDQMAAAVSVIRSVRVLAVFPLFAESLFAVEEDEPVSQWSLLAALSHDARHLKKRSSRRASVVCANEAKVLEEFCVVVAGENHYIARFARKLCDDVDHLAVANGRLRRKLIERHVQAVRLQLADNVIARLRKLRRASRARTDLHLFANMLESTVSINRKFCLRRGGRRGRRRRRYICASCVAARLVAGAGRKKECEDE